MESSVTNLNDTLENLLVELADSLNWEWDDRFDGILATFETVDLNRVSGVLNNHFGQAWDSATISDAPGTLGVAMSNFGGLTPGQLLFTSDPHQAAFLLGMWWPWGNGETVSIRLIPYGLELPDDREHIRATLDKFI